MLELWDEILSRLQPRVNEQIFETWFKPVRFEAVTRDALVLEVPNRYFKDLLSERYQHLLETTAAAVIGRELNVRFEIADANRFAVIPLDNTGEAHVPAGAETGKFLNSRYTFDSFVVGSSNQFAHAAALASADRPGVTYNPLFIYGGVGLGKTHLMHAIGHRIMAAAPSMCVVYVSAEVFTNEVITGIREDRMVEFRKRYRHIDALLIDDIQFIAGKESTQTEFFHTFNALYQDRKQIVVSSDKFPKDMPGLEERLRSRFQWGLIADIQPPSMETKVAILQKKAAIEGISLPDDVAYFIANRIQSNVRELEGYLTRVSAYASVMGSPITLDLAQSVLRNLMADQKPLVTVEAIQESVAKYFGIRLADMRSKTRAHRIAFPRQVAMYLARELTECSLPELGRRFGGKDHSTVLYAHRKMAETISHDLATQKTIEQLRQRILS